MTHLASYGWLVRLYLRPAGTRDEIVREGPKKTVPIHTKTSRGLQTEAQCSCLSSPAGYPASWTTRLSLSAFTLILIILFLLQRDSISSFYLEMSRHGMME